MEPYSNESLISIPKPVINWLFEVIQPIYHDQKRTFHDSVGVLTRFKQLRPRTRVCTDYNGISELLLCIYGKPEVSSPVPLLIWVPKTYPSKHPFVYIDLESLQDAKVSPGRHVDPNGSVSLPLFERWNPDTCNLLQVVQECIKICRHDHILDIVSSGSEKPPLDLPPRLPPIHAIEIPKPPLPRKPTIPQEPSIITPKEEPIPPKFPPKNNTEPESAQGPPLLPKKPPVAPIFDLLDSTITHNTATTHKAIVSDLQHVLNQMSEVDASYVKENLQNRQISIESALRQFDSMHRTEAGALKDIIDSIESTKASLRAEIISVERHVEKIDSYEKENGEELDPSILVSADSASTNQLYELIAKDYALSDTMRLLARLLNRDTITLDIFVKKTRQLGREQFFTRMHIQKVIESLRQ